MPHQNSVVLVKATPALVFSGTPKPNSSWITMAMPTSDRTAVTIRPL